MTTEYVKSLNRHVDFSKYEEQGAYHWLRCYPGNWRKHRPRLHARYDIPIKLLSDRMDLRCSEGADVGCGDGVMLYKLSRKNSRVVGVDYSAEGLAMAKRELEKRGVKDGIRFIQSSCYDMPLREASMDYVVATELIEHLEDAPSLLSEVRRVLRPGGMFVCTTPNREKGQSPDEVKSRFHVHEYIREELFEVLHPYFDTTKVYGACPDWLNKLFYKKDGYYYTDKSLRVTLRMISLFYNPYVHVMTPAPGRDWRLLIGVGIK